MKLSDSMQTGECVTILPDYTYMDQLTTVLHEPAKCESGTFEVSILASTTETATRSG